MPNLRGGLGGAPFRLVDLHWELATPFGISVDSAVNAWHSGRVDAVLTLPDGTVLIGASPGGLWSGTPNEEGEADPSESPELLSGDWPDNGIEALARGPDYEHHAFAGTAGGFLFETRHPGRISKALYGDPLKKWDQIGVFPGEVFQVVVSELARRVAVATRSGVYWSDIPAVSAPYDFRLVQGLPGGVYSGLAEGPNNSIVAAAWGGSHGIYVIDWPGRAAPRVRLATMGGDASFGAMFRTSLCSSAGDGHTMVHAVAANSDIGPSAGIYAVLLSRDGGLTWAPRGESVAASLVGLVPAAGQTEPNSGNQGEYNNCIASAPTAPETVAIGWRRGPWISVGLGPWQEHGDADSGSGGTRHLHGDIHAVYFDPNDRAGRTLFVGSDGGIARTPDLGGNWSSSFNRRLPTLMVTSYGGGGRPLSVSRRQAGLMAIATQDNGCLYAIDGSPGLDWAWSSIACCDGVMVSALANGTVLWVNQMGTSINAVRWTGGLVPIPPIATYASRGRIGRVQPGPPLAATRVAAVVDPIGQTELGETIWAIAAVGATLYRLVGGPKGANPGWEAFATLPTTLEVTAIACLDGMTALVATAAYFTKEAETYSVDCVSGATTKLALPPNLPPRAFLFTHASPIRFIAIQGPDHALCTYEVRDQRLVLSLDRKGGVWQAVPTALPDRPRALEADPFASRPTFFAATRSSVLVSTNLGLTWADVTDGLPRGVEFTDLVVARAIRELDPSPGPATVYVATNGRAVWRGRNPLFN